MRSLKAKVTVPIVASRMKQLDYLCGFRIDTCHGRSFAKITALACKGEIIHFIGAAMLFRDNVFNVVRQFRILLRHQAVLTSIFRALANKTARGGIHG